MDDEKLIKIIVQCCYNVRGTLCAGYLESVYRKALTYELSLYGLNTQEEFPIKVFYKGQTVGEFKADIIVENRVIIELKAIESLCSVHEVQLVNYLTATGLDNGILVNFDGSKIDIRRKYRLYHPKDLTQRHTPVF